VRLVYDPRKLAGVMTARLRVARVLHSVPSFKLWNELRDEAASDPAVATLRQEIQDGLHNDKWAIVDDLFTQGDFIFISDSSPSLSKVLDAVHGVGHDKGVREILHRLRKDLFVPSAHAIVQDFMRAYATCQQNKTEHLHPVGLLQLLDVPSAVWSDVTMDFIEGFPKVSDKYVIHTMVDTFS
jgi:hypothetical protein